MLFGRRFIGAGAISAALLAFGVAGAQVRLPNVLSSHAVLQRDQPIHVWGWSDPGETVTVHFHDQTRTASADNLGKWSLWLTPQHAGGPYTLTAQGSSGTGSGVTLSDILVGDVWVASGQSNMEMPLNGFPGNAVLKNGQQEIAQANLPTVRLLRIEHKPSNFPENDVTATWTECTPKLQPTSPPSPTSSAVKSTRASTSRSDSSTPLGDALQSRLGPAWTASAPIPG